MICNKHLCEFSAAFCPYGPNSQIDRGKTKQAPMRMLCSTSAITVSNSGDQLRFYNNSRSLNCMALGSGGQHGLPERTIAVTVNKPLLAGPHVFDMPCPVRMICSAIASMIPLLALAISLPPSFCCLILDAKLNREVVVTRCCSFVFAILPFLMGKAMLTERTPRSPGGFFCCREPLMVSHRAG